MPHIVASKVPKKELMIMLAYLGKVYFKFALGLIMQWKINSSTAIFEMHSRIIASWLMFLQITIKFLLYKVLTLFINLNAVVVMLPIMAKLGAILKSEWVNASEFLFLLEGELMGITILPYRNIIYFATIYLVLIIFPY